LPITEVLVAEGLNVFGLEIADILVPGWPAAVYVPG
jgi:hypothetical protein